jgi:hypothetical protein
MSDKRTLNFADEDACIADIATLKRGYVAKGNWTLSQVAFHIGYPIAHPLNEPATISPTPEQAKMQQFLEGVAANGWPSSKLDSPPPMVPPPTATPLLVEELIGHLKKLSAYDKPFVDAGPFGPVKTEKYRRFVLNHAAHHLGFLKPIQRRELSYQTVGDLKADLRALKGGYKQAGAWNLPMICWHLAKATEFSMRPGPFPELTLQQLGAKPMLSAVLASGRLPIGISAPEGFVPSADAADSEVDHLIVAMEKAESFEGPFAPHRVFGTLTNAEARQLRLFHCAHHLSYLTPTHQES